MTTIRILPLILMFAPAAVVAQTADYTGLAGSYEVAQNRDYNDVIRGLEATDYEIEDVSTTLLGRTRIMANNGLYRREVVVSSATGEILSDLLLELPLDDDTRDRRAAMAAGSDPKPDEGAVPQLDISGSITLGVNSNTGGFGRAGVTVGKENINGSGVSAWVSVYDNF